MKCILLLITTVFLFCACSHTIGKKFDADKIARIQKCQTTKSELIQWFGPPKGADTTGKIETLSWQYAKLSAFGGHKDEQLTAYLNSKGKVISYVLGTNFVNKLAQRMESDDPQPAKKRVVDDCGK